MSFGFDLLFGEVLKFIHTSDHVVLLNINFSMKNYIRIQQKTELGNVLNVYDLFI